jgi:hypothetical protein
MREPPGAQEEGQLPPSLFGVERVHVHDGARIVGDGMRDAAASEQAAHELGQ